MSGWKERFRDIAWQRLHLMELVSQYIPLSQEKIERACTLAERAHQNQTRYEGDLYVIHPFRITVFLIESMEEKDPDVVIAALLHDVVEDTDVTLDDIQEQFGQRAAEFVDSVTRPRTKTETEADKFTTKPLAYQKVLASPIETIRIKAADLLDNMRSWEMNETWVRTSGKLPRWLDEARTYYLPIGQRVGYGVKEEMEKIVEIFAC